MSRAKADFHRTAQKLAAQADFTSDMATWPDSMVRAYLSSWTETEARERFLELLLEEAENA